MVPSPNLVRWCLQVQCSIKDTEFVGASSNRKLASAPKGTDMGPGPAEYEWATGSTVALVKRMNERRQLTGQTGQAQQPFSVQC